MTVLYLARHGETIWHAENRYAGSSDISITPTGADQAKRLARWAAVVKPDRVVSSPLRRAYATASPAADVLGVAVHTDERLREIDFGRAEGLTQTEMSEAFPEFLSAFLSAPADNPLPDAESGRVGCSRAEPALQELCNKYPTGRILVVCHSTLIRLLLCRMLGIDLNLYRSIFPRLENVAITTVEKRRDAGFALLGFNAPPLVEQDFKCT